MTSDLLKNILSPPLLALQSIISYSGNNKELLAIRGKACFLTGKYYEFLKQDSEAWLTYCEMKDKDSSFYEEVVNARRDLLKNFIKKQFDELIVSAVPLGNLALEENPIPAPNPQEKPENLLFLPNGIPISLSFPIHWSKDSDFFHSVNELALEKQYKKQHESIETMLEAKKEEITLVKKAIEKKFGDPNQMNAKKALFETELEQLKKIKTKIKNHYQQHTADYRKTLRRHNTETRFFDPKRLKKPEVLEKLRDLTCEIIDRRFSLNSTILPPLELAGISSRMLITAERVFQEAVVTLSGESNIALGIPRVRATPWTFGNGSNGYGAVERYKVANTKIQAEHRTSPKRQRLGDSYMPQHGRYTGDIYPFLKRISDNNSDNVKAIANYLIRYSKTHQGLTLEELEAFYPDADEKDVNDFNQIAFLIMEKEQAQWHSATDKDYQLGISISQARALRMLEAGFLNLDEVFKNDVLFGVYSQTGIINSPQKVSQACQRIDELYTSFILSRHRNDSMQFFKLQIKDQEKRTPVLTRAQAHEDLQYVYGGDTDSDGEGYSTDLGF